MWKNYLYAKLWEDDSYRVASDKKNTTVHKKSRYGNACKADNYSTLWYLKEN